MQRLHATRLSFRSQGNRSTVVVCCSSSIKCCAPPHCICSRTWTATKPTAYRYSCSGTTIGTFPSCAGSGVASVVRTGDDVGDDVDRRAGAISRQTRSPPPQVSVACVGIAVSIALYTDIQNSKLGRGGKAAEGRDGQAKGCPWCLCSLESRDRQRNRPHLHSLRNGTNRTC